MGGSGPHLIHWGSPEQAQRSGAVRVFDARGKRLCCRSRQSDRQLIIGYSDGIGVDCHER